METCMETETTSSCSFCLSVGENPCCVSLLLVSWKRNRVQPPTEQKCNHLGKRVQPPPEQKCNHPQKRVQPSSSKKYSSATAHSFLLLTDFGRIKGCFLLLLVRLLKVGKQVKILLSNLFGPPGRPHPVLKRISFPPCSIVKAEVRAPGLNRCQAGLDVGQKNLSLVSKLPALYQDQTQASPSLS